MKGSRRTAAWIAIFVALSGACGSNTAAERTCRQEGGAKVCLEEAGAAYNLEGTGLRPRSEILVVNGDEERRTVLTTDGAGRLPGEGVAGFLPDRTAQRITVTGPSASGSEVRFEFEVPAARG